MMHNMSSVMESRITVHNMMDYPMSVYNRYDIHDKLHDESYVNDNNDDDNDDTRHNGHHYKLKGIKHLPKIIQLIIFSLIFLLSILNLNIF